MPIALNELTKHKNTLGIEPIQGNYAYNAAQLLHILTGQ